MKFYRGKTRQSRNFYWKYRGSAYNNIAQKGTPTLLARWFKSIVLLWDDSQTGFKGVTKTTYIPSDIIPKNLQGLQCQHKGSYINLSKPDSDGFCTLEEYRPYTQEELNFWNK